MLKNTNFWFFVSLGNTTGSADGNILFHTLFLFNTKSESMVKN